MEIQTKKGKYFISFMDVLGFRSLVENEDIVKMKIIDRVLDACIFELYFNLNAGLLRNLASSLPDIDPISVELKYFLS